MRHFETFLGAYEPIPLGHKFAAKVIHKSMYLCLALLPLSGLLIAGLFKLGVKSGILQNFAIAFHEFCAFLSYVLISIHIAAAIYSRLRRKGIWTSMVPLWPEVEVISSSRTKTKDLEWNTFAHRLHTHVCFWRRSPSRVENEVPPAGVSPLKTRRKVYWATVGNRRPNVVSLVIDNNSSFLARLRLLICHTYATQIRSTSSVEF